MRPFLVIWLTICLASLPSAFQQPTNPWATIPKLPHGVSVPYDSKAERASFLILRIRLGPKPGSLRCKAMKD